MGFGSYDESEQENQDVETTVDEDTVENPDAEHDGEMEFEGMDDTDQLLSRLNDMQEE